MFLLKKLLGKQFVIPAPLTRMISLMPSYPGSIIFASVLNYVLGESITQDMHQITAGKRLRFSVTDAGLNFNCVWSPNGFAACSDIREPDVLIRATVQDFVLLVTRQEDPDTLFFSRRLVMEGDTETGVLLKNTMDSLDLHIPSLMKAAPVQALGSLFKSAKRKQV